MNKMGLCHSAWIIAPPSFDGTSCVLKNGKLNKKRFGYFCEIAVECSATHFRVLPFLMEDKKIKKMKDKNYLYMPFEQISEIPLKFDLSKINPIWEQNLIDMVDIANSYGLTMILPFDDRCHGDQMDRIYDSPWFLQNNINNVHRFWYAGNYHDNYVDRILQLTKDKNTMYEFINEPQTESKRVNIPINILIAFTKKIYDRMKFYGITDNRIISGIEYIKDGEVSNIYETWRMKLDIPDSHGDNVSRATVHKLLYHLEQKTFDVINLQNASRNVFLSMDGDFPKPGEIYKSLDGLFLEYSKKKNIMKNKLHLNGCIFEWLDQSNGFRNGSLEVSKVINKYFGYWPGKTPTGRIIEDPGNIEEKEDETPVIPDIPPDIIPEKKEKEEMPKQKEETFWRKNKVIIGIGSILISLIFAQSGKNIDLFWMSILAVGIPNIPWIMKSFLQKRK